MLKKEARKASRCVIPITWHSEKGKNVGSENRPVAQETVQRPGGNGNVLYLDDDGGHMIVETYVKTYVIVKTPRTV